MKKAWMPLAAGIIIVVAGSLGVLRRSMMFAMVKLILPSLVGISPVVSAVIAGVSWPVLIAGIVVAFLAIVGGVYALRRKIWGLVLAGSIAALFCSAPLGIAAVVLIALSRKEFAQP